jgi:hypothetical protein
MLAFEGRSRRSVAESKPASMGPSWCRALVSGPAPAWLHSFDHLLTGVVVGRNFGAGSGCPRFRAFLSRRMVELRTYRRREARHPVTAAKRRPSRSPICPVDAAFDSCQARNQPARQVSSQIAPHSTPSVRSWVLCQARNPPDPARSSQGPPHSAPLMPRLVPTSYFDSK